MLLAVLSGPHIDFAALSPLLALLGGAVIVLGAGIALPAPSASQAGQLRPGLARGRLVPAVLALLCLALTLALLIWQWHDQRSIVAGALRIDGLALTLSLILVAGGAAAILLAARSSAVRAHGGSELYALLLTSLAGMFTLVAAQDSVIFFLGFELLSVPLYVLCAIERRNERALESGLKYLIIGSLGGAMLLYGLALIYGASGQTGFTAIAEAISTRSLGGNAMLLAGIGLCVAGLSFKSSVAPFHQWTPDVYEGAPTPITAFMAVATKVAALGGFLRLFDVALIGAQPSWAPALAALASVTILAGNLGALGQSSLKRMLGFSAVAQAGYMLAGVVVSTRLGVRATVLYLAGYMFMNLAAFAVIIARERASDLGDSIEAIAGLGRRQPLLAMPMTVAMLGLAGIPATIGFLGKFYLIAAAATNGYTWLGIVIVIGSLISLGYYLPVIAAMWMREADLRQPASAPSGPGSPTGALPAIAGGSSEADSTPAAGAGPTDRQPELLAVALAAGAATLFFGIIPGPLFNLLARAGNGLGLY